MDCDADASDETTVIRPGPTEAVIPSRGDGEGSPANSGRVVSEEHAGDSSPRFTAPRFRRLGMTPRELATSSPQR
jgi:hypothetical protein